MLVYGIHGGEPPHLLDDFIEQTGVTYPIVADNGTLWRISFPPGSGYPYPRDVLVGKDLRVRAIRNSFNVEELAEQIEALLAE